MIKSSLKFIVSCAIGFLVIGVVVAEYYSYKKTTDSIESSIDGSITYVINSIAKYSTDAADIQRQKEPQDLKSDRVRDLLSRTIKENIQLRARLALLVEVYVGNIFLLSNGGIDLDLWANSKKIFVCERRPESVALLKISTDLRTMIPMEQIFLNASVSAADQLVLRNFIQLVDGVRRESSVETFGEIIVGLTADYWMEVVICSIRRDPYLREYFDLELRKAESFLFQNPKPITIKRKDDGFPDFQWARANAPIFCNFATVKTFLKFFEGAFFNEMPPYCGLTAAVVEVAQRGTVEDANKLNEIFHDTLLAFVDDIKIDVVLHQFISSIQKTRPALAEQIWKVQRRNDVLDTFKALRGRQPVFSRRRTNTFEWTFQPRIMF